MPLTIDQEALECELRVQQLKADIDLKHAQTRKSEQDWRLEPQRVIIRWVIGTAVIFGGTGVLLGYLLSRGH